MDTLSEKLARAVELEITARPMKANPVRRGPVILAANGTSPNDGTSPTDAPAVAAHLIAERLGLPVVVVSAVDNTASKITRVARESSATMVVLGSSPHRRLHHTTSGERAIQLLHSSPCPVLSVPPTFTTLPRSVLVAVDFGPSSVRAAQAAMLLVADEGTVTLTHVVPTPVRPEWLRIVPEEDLAVNLHALFDTIREEMGPCVPDGINLDTRIIEGRTEDAILSATTQFGSDAIAIGTHGASLITRALLGSVADGIIRRTDHTILVAPPPSPDEARER